MIFPQVFLLFPQGSLSNEVGLTPLSCERTPCGNIKITCGNSVPQSYSTEQYKAKII